MPGIETGQASPLVRRVEVEDHRAILVLAGELDLATVDELQQCFCALLSQGCSRFTIDMAEVSFIDSSALNVFVRVARSLESGYLTLVNPAQNVRRVIEITGLDNILRVPTD